MIKVSQSLTKALTQKYVYRFSDNFLSGNNALYAEQMYASWLKEKSSVHVSWDAYFTNISKDIPHSQAFITPESLALGKMTFNAPVTTANIAQITMFHKVTKMINLFRAKGHYAAEIDPLHLTQGQVKHKLGEDFFSAFESGISEVEYDTPLDLSALGESGFHTSKAMWTPREVYENLKQIYCGKIGFQYHHITNPKIVEWIQKRVENSPIFKKTSEEKLKLLERILESQAFNAFCERKYSTYKRFGCEGMDSGISGMGKITEIAAKHKIAETVIGMAHRGRLNLSCCVLKKPYNQIFAEFEDIKYNAENEQIYKYSGDVKYHIGCSNKVIYHDNHEMVINLLPNLSHLEAVYPVALGPVKARQSTLNDSTGKMVLPVVIHGDAALAGQGVIYKTQQMEKLASFNVGGTIHTVFNNQIRFTTDPLKARSGHYPTNIAQINNNFVIHVNADEPEEVDFAMELAVDYRMEFLGDVYINLVGYRRFGHNEQDNAQFTQPEMFGKIQDHPYMYHLYARRLQKEKVITKEAYEARLEHYMQTLDQKQKRTLAGDINKEVWDPYGWNELDSFELKSTGLTKQKFMDIGEKINTLPVELNAHRTLKKI